MGDLTVDWWEAARVMLLSRRLDALETGSLTPQGKIKYQFSAGGHELGQVLLAQALDHPHDAVTVYYRSRPLLLAAGLSVAEALAAGMARDDSPSRGRDVGVVFNLPRRGGPTILPASGDVGAQYTPAAGWAQAICYRQRVLGDAGWQGAIAVACGGEASVAANGFWSALNIATTENLPLLFFIENNRYGISVPAECQTPGGNIAANLAAYGNLHVLDGDGVDPQEAWELVRRAVAWTRRASGPCLLHLRVVRLGGHTFIDDQSYKPAELRQAEADNDPLAKMRAFLVEAEPRGSGVGGGAQESDGFLPERSERSTASAVEGGGIGASTALRVGRSDKVGAARWAEMEAEVEAELAAALERAESSPAPAAAEVTRHIFFAGEAPVQGGLRVEGANLPSGETPPRPQGARINLIDAVRRALEAEMRLNPRLLLFGEDVGVKGGVHGATLDMQRHFGAERVFDTSLSEEGIIGRAVGMALAGLLPAPEIQFRKYADPAHEQISDLGTLRWRTANHFAAPVVVRIPVGYSKKTGDPWHSVSAEAVYAHTPGWRIAYPSNAEDAVGLLRSALRGDDPTFFFEHRALLDTPEGRRPYPGDEYCLPFGRAATLLEGDELAVITWGAMTPRCLEAASAFPGRVRLLDLRTIIPWDREAVLQAVRAAGKVLVVHEDTLTAGFGAEIVATIAAEAFTDLDAPVERLAPPDIPIPYAIGSMEAVIPSVEKIRTAMENLLDY